MSATENTAEQKICKIIKDAFKLGFDSETNDAIDYFDGIDESEEIISQLRANTSHFAEQVHSIAAALGMPVAPGHSVIHRVKELVAEKEQLRLERNRACRERDDSDTEIEWVKRICFGGELPCVKPNSEVFEIFAAIKKLKNERDKLREQLHRATQLFGNLTMAYRKLSDAAQAVIERWESPAWKDNEPTAHVIYKLRDTLWPISKESKT